MHIQRKNNPFQGPSYDRYNQLRQQLQRQNATLLKQRSKIQNENDGYRPLPSQNTIVQKNQFSIREEEQADEIQLPHFDAPVVDKGKSARSTYKSGKQKSIREEINNRGELLSDDVMEMIDQIQRKALEEIQSLRNDKIQLMRKLNKQIKENNAQKKARVTQNKQRKQVQQQRKGNSNSRIQFSKPQIPMPIQQQNSQENQQTNRRNYQQQDDVHFNSNENSKTSHMPNSNPVYPQHIQSQNPSYSQPVQNPNSAYPQQRPMIINNQNVIPSQSLYYVNKPKSNQSQNIPNARTPNVQEPDIEKQINRLRQQNNNLKNNLSEFQTTTYTASDNFKNRLKSQLSGLYSKAKYFENLISRQQESKQNDQSQNLSGGHFETLLLQGANLAEEGQRLMRVKSDPQFNVPSDLIRPQKATNSRMVIGTIQMDRSMQTPMENSRRGGGGGMDKFSPGEYERLIQNMRRAANI